VTIQPVDLDTQDEAWFAGRIKIARKGSRSDAAAGLR
jgi:hypothetical protein